MEVVSYDGKKEFRAYYKKINFPIGFLYSAKKTNDLIKECNLHVINQLKDGNSLKNISDFCVNQLEMISSLIWTGLYKGRTPKYGQMFTEEQINNALGISEISIDDMQRTWYSNIGILLKLKIIQQEDYVNGWQFMEYNP